LASAEKSAGESKNESERSQPTEGGSASVSTPPQAGSDDAAAPPLDSKAGTPREIWNDYFSKRKPRPEVVSQLILKLHEGRQHEHVIAAIEAALRHGQSQPWMYDVLALSMELTGRPQAEIERVLLSRVDFTATDVPSMLYSAAYLTRFGGRKQALRLYRQASQLEPTRPEPYVLGLPLAQQQKDYDAIRWAAAGVLVSAWGRDHERQHLRARDAAAQAAIELRKEQREDEAAALEAAVNDALKRDLVLELTWSGDGDLDLSVEEPAGTVCSVEDPQSRGGGVHLRDGYGPEQKNCRETYVCAFGVPGNYRVRVHHVDGNIVGKRAKLQITRAQGSSEETTQTLTIPISKDDATVLVALPHGRRTELKAPQADAETEIGAAEIPRVPAPGDTAEAAKVLERFNASRVKAAVVAGDRRSLSAGAGIAAAVRSPGGAGAAAAGVPFAAGAGAGVGPGAVGYTPVVSVVSEGVAMSALAVVSGDRRYVRLSVAPSFSAITDVFTFTFLNSPAPGGQPTGN